MSIERDDDKHRYGRHYTPEPVASLLAAFAIRSPDDLVLDPSCGDGRLIKASLETKQVLGVRNEGRGQHSATNPGAQVFGFELMKSAVDQARKYGATIGVADFFDISPGAVLSDSFRLPDVFDAIIGNPPYIRQELIGAQKKARILELIDEPVELVEDFGDTFDAFDLGTNLRRSKSRRGGRRKQWSSRSDIYVYFFAHAERFLKPGGRLVFITSSSWLDVGYGLELREFLLDRFNIIALIESAAESFFEDASVNTTITVLEKEADPVKRSRNTVRFVQLRSPLAAIVDAADFDSIAFSRVIEGATDSYTDESVRLRAVTQASLRASRTRCEGTAPDSRNRTAQSQGLHVRESARAGEASSTNAPFFAPQTFETQTLETQTFETRAFETRAFETRAFETKTWGRYLRAEDVFFTILDRACPALRKLEDVARVRYGIKTGANDFFYLKDVDGAANPRLRRLIEMAHLRRGVTTGANDFFYLRKLDADGGGTATASGTENPDNRGAVCDPAPTARGTLRPDARSMVVDGGGREFEIEEAFLRPVLFSLKEIPRIVIQAGQGARLLFDCNIDRSGLAGTGALAYIEAAESDGVHLRPTCRGRNPWYSAIRGMKPAPLIFPSKVGERWVVAINNAGVYEDKKLYGIFPADGVPMELLAALLNSTWARYYVESTCRQLTGAQAIADIDVAVAEQIALPDPGSIEPQLQSALISALVELGKRDTISIFQETAREDRRILDDLVLLAMGFIEPDERADVLSQLYGAVTQLVRERLARGQGKSNSVRRKGPS